MSRRIFGVGRVVWTLLIGTLAALVCTSAAGLDRDRNISQLHHTGWTVKDGAPPDVWALAQASDGYLWLGTGVGLYRFDGVRFERFQPRAGGQFLSNNMTALTALPSGEIWIGYYFGGASVLKDGLLTSYGEREGMPAGVVFRFARDEDGGLWVATAGGLARLEGNRWRKIGSDWGYPSDRADWLFVDRDGTLWVATHETLVFLRRGARRFELTGERVAGLAVVAQAQDGTLWVSDDLRGTRPLLDAGQASKPQPSPVQSGRAPFVQSKRILFDRDGNLWGTDSVRGGVYRVASPERLGDALFLSPDDVSDAFTLKDGLTADIAVPLLEDAEGSIWVGTNLGLNQFRRNSVVVERRIPATSPDGFALATDDRGNVFVGNPNALFRIAPDSMQVLADTLPEISCAYRSGNGYLWLGGPEGLMRLEGERLVRTPFPPELVGNEVQSMAGERSGALWVSISGKGVYRFADNSWKLWGKRSDLPKLTANAAAVDGDGRIWFGYSDSLVAVLDDARVRTFSSQEGLNVGHVMTIQSSAQRIWVGGEMGVAQLEDSRFRTLGTARVQALNGISGIIETRAGDLWLNGNLGIVRISLAEFERALDDPRHRPRYELFDFRDGLPGVAQQAIPVPTAVAAADGKLWFATNHGVVWIDPQRIIKNRVPPPLVIRSLTAGGKRYLPASFLQLPERTSSLRIDYTALSFSVPERVRFQYRLEGADTQWRDASARREAFYTNLDPGRYRFQVIAANDDGVWNLTGAALEFSIKPTFTQTRSFQVLCALAILGAMWLLYLLRLRQITARMNGRLEERLRERERIARELHDTLLQGVQGLILRFQAAAARIPASEPARGLMEQALDRADQVLTEGRDRVKDLRGPMQSPRELSEAFAAAGEELAQGRTTHFRVLVEGLPRRLHPVVSEEAWRIGREALLNAFQHAHAKQIEVEVAHGRRQLRVRVRDDGQGIDEQIIHAGNRVDHWGLVGMRERARKIRAQLDIWSRPGLGTEIELRVPAALAYADEHSRPRRSWLRRLRPRDSVTEEIR